MFLAPEGDRTPCNPQYLKMVIQTKNTTRDLYKKVRGQEGGGVDYPRYIATRYRHQTGGFFFRPLVKMGINLLTRKATKAIASKATKAVAKKIGKTILKKGIEETSNVLTKKKNFKKAAKDFLKSTARESGKEIIKQMKGGGPHKKTTKVVKLHKNDVFTVHKGI